MSGLFGSTIHGSMGGFILGGVSQFMSIVHVDPVRTFVYLALCKFIPVLWLWLTPNPHRELLLHERFTGLQMGTGWTVQCSTYSTIVRRVL